MDNVTLKQQLSLLDLNSTQASWKIKRQVSDHIPALNWLSSYHLPQSGSPGIVPEGRKEFCLLEHQVHSCRDFFLSSAFFCFNNILFQFFKKWHLEIWPYFYFPPSFFFFKATNFISRSPPQGEYLNLCVKTRLIFSDHVHIICIIHFQSYVYPLFLDDRFSRVPLPEDWVIWSWLGC